MTEVFKFFSRLFFEYGPYTAFMTTLMLIILYIAFHIIKTQLSEDIKRESNEKLEKIKSELEKERDEFVTKLKGEIDQNLEFYKNNLEKEMELLFINEPIRKELAVKIGHESNSIRIDLFKEIYNLFFEIIYTIAETRKLNKKNDEDKIKTIFDNLYEKLTNARIKIFVNAVHAPRLTDFLLSAVIGLREDVDIRYSELTTGYKISEKNLSYNASNELDNAQKWLMENLKTNMTPKELEIITDDIKNVNEKKNLLINELKQNFS